MMGIIQLTKPVKNRRGVTTVLVAVMMTMFAGFIALAVDVGYVMVTRNELQNVADAAALAAARYIGHTYEGMAYGARQSYFFEGPDIVSVAQSTGFNNKAGGRNITVNDADVIIGKWNAGTKTLYDIDNYNKPNAVRVIARRDSLANGPITTFFAKIFGQNTVDVSAKATAALTSESTSAPGNLIPVGIDQQWFLNKEVFCDQVIKFYPTNTPEGCAGWHTFFRDPSSESYLRDTILEGWLAGTYTSPGASTGDIINLPM